MQNNELANLMPGNENKWTLPCSNGKVCRKKYRQPHGKLVGTYYLVERNHNKRFKLLHSEFDQTPGPFKRENISTFS